MELLTDDRSFQDRQYAATVLTNPWMIQNPHWPLENKRQALFLGYTGREALFGGSVGGGKSSALLMAAAQYVEVPGYSALVIRRSFRDAEQADALIPRSKEWWGGRVIDGKEARWSEINKRWTFPSGATITFGYMDKAGDETQFQSAAFQLVCWDELTQFRESQYRYMFSRLRKPMTGALSRVPIRMRAATNPGGRGAAWVKRRFIPPHGTRFFVPSFLRDNPYLNAEDYVRGMAHMTPEQRKQLLAGSWGEFEGGRFKRDWFYLPDSMEIAHPWWTEHGPDGAVYVCVDNGHEIRKFNIIMCWQFVMCDPAASEKDTADYTAIGAFMVTPDRDLLVLDVVREHLDIDAIVPRLAEVCQAYQPSWVGIEAVAFQVSILRQAQKHPLIPAVRGFEPEGKGKLVRATPAIIRCANGQVYLPQAGVEAHPWIETFVEELVSFSGLESSAAIKAAESEGHAAGDAYDDQCLVGGTMVKTPVRDVPIEDVKIGDWVLGRDGWRLVRCAGMTNPRAKVYEVVTTSGTIIGTSGHPVWTENRGFVRIDTLTYGDIVMGCVKPSSSTASNSIGIHNQNPEVCGCIGIQPRRIENAASVRCTKKSGKQPTDQSQEIMTSTTRISIRPTTVSTTSNASPRKSIEESTPLLAQAPKCANTLKIFGRSQASGTDPKPDEHGTAAMRSKRGRKESRLSARAYAAASGIHASPIEERKSSVPTPARQPTGAHRESTTLNGPAPAERNSRSIATVASRLVPGRVLSVKAIESARAVYNLTVDGGEYVAGNILVHNCDMLAYAVQALDRFGLSTGPVVVDADLELMAAEAEYGKRNGYFTRFR